MRGICGDKIGSFFQSKTINGFGPAATKAAGCFSSFETYLFLPFGAIASSFLNYTGQNYGSKKKNKIVKYSK